MSASEQRISGEIEKASPKRFNFSLGRLLLATAFLGAGIALFSQSGGDGWGLIAYHGAAAAFGAGVGCLLRRTIVGAILATTVCFFCTLGYGLILIERFIEADD